MALFYFLIGLTAMAAGVAMLFLSMTILGIFVALLGFPLVAATGALLSDSWRRRALARKFPGRAWRHEGIWQNFEVRSGSLLELVIGWGSALMLFLLANMIFWGTAQEMPVGSALLAAFFAALGLVPMVPALRGMLQYRKWGRPRLVFPRLPFRPGERLEGVVLCTRRISAADGFHLTLLCSEDRPDWHDITRRDLHTGDEIVDSDMAAEGGCEGTAIPVDIQIPGDMPGTQEEKGRSTYWQLEVEAAMPGIDFAATFDLPIYELEDDSLVEFRPQPVEGESA